MAQRKENFNKEVKAYKNANPEKTHDASQFIVKEYYDKIKHDPDVGKIVEGKVAEWKREGLQKRSKTNIFSFWKKTPNSSNSGGKSGESASNVEASAEDDAEIEILPSQSNGSDAPDASSSSSASQQPADVSQSSSVGAPPPAKKTWHAEIVLDRTIRTTNNDITTFMHFRQTIHSSRFGTVRINLIVLRIREKAFFLAFKSLRCS